MRAAATARAGRFAAWRHLLGVVLVSSLVIYAEAAAASTGCITTNHGALDLSTTITKARFFNYGGEFDVGETLRFVTNSGTLSVTLSRNRFGHPPEFLRWSGSASRDYPITKAGDYSFQVVLSAIPFQTATLAVACIPVGIGDMTAPPPSMIAPAPLPPPPQGGVPMSAAPPGMISAPPGMTSAAPDAGAPAGGQ
jgi:hypothetical protein